MTRRAVLIGGASAVLLTACSGRDSSDGAGRSPAEARSSPSAGSSSPSTSAVEACRLTPELTAGPYYLDGPLVRSDITEGRPGRALELRVRVLALPGCQPLAGAAVDIWHCDANGEYSGFNGNSLAATQAQGRNDKRYLRGIQVTDGDGVATFRTVFPGWYEGRAVHIHLKVHEGGTATSTYTGGHVVHVGQAFFDEAQTAELLATGVYRAHTGTRTTNEEDSIYRQAGPGAITTLTEAGSGTSGFRGEFTCTVDPSATPPDAPMF